MPFLSGANDVIARGALRLWLANTLLATLVAGLFSGAPSTVWALVTDRDPWEATLAAGRLLLPAETSFACLVAAAALVHGAVSLFWAGVLCAVLPRRHAVLTGAAAGGLIAVLDLLVIGRALSAINTLPFGPQLADHRCSVASPVFVVAYSHAARPQGRKTSHDVQLD